MTERAPIPQPEPAPERVDNDIVNHTNSFETIKIPAGENVQIVIIPHGEVTIMVNRMGSEPIHADAPVVEAPAQTEQKPEREKVDITGRIATDPKYSERKAGRRTLKFVLAEHPEPATTNFHKITMWNERADKYNGTLTKGEEVRVVGNLREFTYTDKKTGEKKQGSEIYAWGVGKPKRERPSNSGASAGQSDQ